MPADLIAKIRQYPKTAAFVLGSLRPCRRISGFRFYW